jgi:two-component system cell cycle response regulator DivK
MTTLTDASIIIVEDEPNSYLATIELLKLHGVSQIHPFKNGRSVLEFLEAREEPVDLFLVDIHMPGETGLDLIKLLRETIGGADAQIIALTAGVLFEDIRRVRAAGFDGFIGKPLKPYEFPQQLERILNGESLWEWR